MSAFFGTVALFRLLVNNRFSVEALQKNNTERLRELFIEALNVPRHRLCMERSRYDPRRDFKGISDLALFPVMTKEELKRAPNDFIRDGATAKLDMYFSDRTSGSSGKPLKVYRSPIERDIQIAKWLRVLLLSGYRPTEKVLSYTSPGRLTEGRIFLQHLGLLRRKAVDYTLPSDVLADELLSYRPHVIYGVRTSLLLVAEALERRSLQAPPVKLVIAGGEVIDSKTRETCRKAFGVDVTETYGSVEMGVMAYQRQEGRGLTLIEDCTLFEFLDESGNPAKPGQIARVVVTDLHGRIMPFIRYEQGDSVVFGVDHKNPSKRVRIIEKVIGRQDDIASLPDGSILTYLNFYEIMDFYPGVAEFRVLQRNADLFLVDIVASADYYQRIKPELIEKLRSLSRLSLTFDVQRRDRIDADKSGKRRFLISAINK